MVKPNTVCRNEKCTHGRNGQRKNYYSCKYCLRVESYRSVACCPECYEAYVSQITEARRKGKSVNLMPERTDMNVQEIAELRNKTIDEIKAESIEELTEMGYGEELEEIGLTGVIDKINEPTVKDESERITSCKRKIRKQDKIQSIQDTLPEQERNGADT